MISCIIPFGFKGIEAIRRKIVDGNMTSDQDIIRFDNFKAQYAHIREEIDTAVHRVLDSGWFILGKELESFEKEFAQYIGCNYCVGVGNGTDAITLSLMALGIGRGDEVITPNMTAFPTISGIMKAGAAPVVTDICFEDGLMDVTKIAAKINKNTKAIMPVHLYGQSCDMDPICELARQYGLHVVEDCAQSVGAAYKTKKTGAIGEIGAFSFYPTKNLGAYGDAGAVLTNDETIYQKLLSLRNYGQRVRYYHDEFGFNSRLDEIQAAILKVKLKYLDGWNEKRRSLAASYREKLHTVSCLQENSYGLPVYHLFVIKTRKRDKLMEYLKSRNIQTLIHYPVPMSKQKGFGLQRDESFPGTMRFAEEILSIPIYPELSDENLERTANEINTFCAGNYQHE